MIFTTVFKGMLVYILVMSKEHILVFCYISMVLISDMRFIVFWTLNVLGSVMYSPIIFERKKANLYAGAINPSCILKNPQQCNH
jgi:hypothetical protein